MTTILSTCRKAQRETGHTNVLCTLTSIEKALGTQLSRILADETMSESFMVG